MFKSQLIKDRRLTDYYIEMVLLCTIPGSENNSFPVSGFRLQISWLSSQKVLICRPTTHCMTMWISLCLYKYIEICVKICQDFIRIGHICDRKEKKITL